VRKKFLPFTIAVALVLSLTVSPVVRADSKHTTLVHRSFNKFSKDIESAEEHSNASVEAKAISLYEQMDLGKLGLALNAMKYAYKGFENLHRTGALSKNSILTICDFSQSSRNKRMYILDLENKKVLIHTYVAHGKNSGLDYANRFSNTPESLQSSLGFYKTKSTYFGKHGLSLRLQGLEPGWNDKAEERAIVLHGAGYIGDHRIGAPYMGRSFGCPAVPKELSDEVINLIKDGTCFFIYHPSNRYLHGSRILND